MCCSSDIHVYVKVERNVSLANSHKMFQMVASFTRCFKLDKYHSKAIYTFRNMGFSKTPYETYRYMFLFSFPFSIVILYMLSNMGVANYIKIDYG